MSNKTQPNNKKKLTYDVVLTTGKAARALKRARLKQSQSAFENHSPLGKMRNRQERKAIAKSLKIAFNPRYNGIVINKGWKLVTAKNEKYTKLVLEAK